ncbi:hypothetical protein V6N12_053599 [Hibiscus sabdariffa]|uniref:RNase H type-1 domain-containing protein n=1 Tax=Hibiscus sabdariffa TaxID=183260 RepID=A0ABR2D8E7_9ROSI
MEKKGFKITLMIFSLYFSSLLISGVAIATRSLMSNVEPVPVKMSHLESNVRKSSEIKDMIGEYLKDISIERMLVMESTDDYPPTGPNHPFPPLPPPALLERENNMPLKLLTSVRCAWKCPSTGVLKFNVDGAVAGAFGKAGIGGLLRDADGKILLMFSRSIGFIDSTSAEILALKEACSLFSKSEWARVFSLVLETDCSLLVDWFGNPLRAPPGFRMLVKECLDLCLGCAWSIRVVSREANCTADKLAKSGIGRSKPLVWILGNYVE